MLWEGRRNYFNIKYHLRQDIPPVSSSILITNYLTETSKKTHLIPVYGLDMLLPQAER